MPDVRKSFLHSTLSPGIYNQSSPGGSENRNAKTIPSSMSFHHGDTFKSYSGRTPYDKSKAAQITLDNARMNSSIKPAIPPFSEKPHIPKYEPLMHSNSLLTNLHTNDSGTIGNNTIGI